MNEHLFHAQAAKNKIETQRPQANPRKQGWQKILIENLQNLSTMLMLVYSYLQDQSEPDSENLEEIRSNIRFVGIVIHEDVFQYAYELTSNQPMNENPKRWQIFVSHAKELVNELYWNVIDELDNYIELLKQKEELESSSRAERWTLATIKKNILVVREQRREFINAYIVFMNRLVSMVNQLR